MRPIKPNTRRRSLWRTVLLALVAIVIGGAGTVAALAGLKVIDLGQAGILEEARIHPADWIAIPLSARPIPAYTEVTREYLMNVKTGEWVLAWSTAGSGSERRHHQHGEDSRPGDGTREAGRLLLPGIRFSAPGHPPRDCGRHALGQAGVYLRCEQSRWLRV